MRIFIVRHGESQGNIKEIDENRYIIDTEVELTKIGLEQAKRAGESLSILLEKYSVDRDNVEMWVSPFKRTRQTAKEINEYLNIKSVREDPRLAEQDFGDFDFQYYLKWPDISPHSWFINQARYHSETGRFFARVENGENLADVYNRISIFVETRLLKTNKDKVVVAHGSVGKVLTMYLLDEKIEWTYHNKASVNAGIRELELVNDTWVDRGYVN
jgi:broad specificity phosphatase PhoE